VVQTEVEGQEMKRESNRR